MSLIRRAPLPRAEPGSMTSATHTNGRIAMLHRRDQLVTVRP